MRFQTLIFALFLTLSLNLQGQVRFMTDYSATTEIWLHGDSIRIHQELLIPPSEDTLYFPVWLAGYASRHSFLAQQMLEEQHARQWYSLPKTPIHQVIDAHRSQGILLFSTGSHEVLGIYHTLPTWDTLRIQLDLPIPEEMPTGFGRIQGAIRLFHLFHPPLRHLQKADLPLVMNHMRQQIPHVRGIHKVWIRQWDEGTPLLIEDRTGNDDLIVQARSMLEGVPRILVENGQDTLVPALPSFDRIERFLKEQGLFSDDKGVHWDRPIIFTQNPEVFTGTHALIIPVSSDSAKREAEIVRAYIRELTRDRGWDPVTETWMIEGLSGYLAQHYLETYYPDQRLLGPFANSLVSKFFDLEQYPPYYLNQYFYLFLARENLDEELSLEAPLHSQLGYRSAYRGKSVQVFRFARDWVEDANFRRGIHRWFQDTTLGASDFWRHQRYYSNQDLSWVDGELITTDKKVDYSLTDVEYCSTVYTATVKNQGDLATPYLITGFRNGKKVIDVRYDGHLKKKTQNFHHDRYDKVEINAPGNFPELNYRNNSRYPDRWLSGFKPFRLQFYTSFENPDRTQIFWLPSLKFNAYDKVLIGVQFYNRTVVPKKWEYRIAPDFSTGTGQLTGLASLKYNHLPSASPFRRISYGVYARYFHYDQDLAFFRWSPAVNFYFRKPSPRSQLYRSLTVRMVNVDKEIPNGPISDANPSFQPSAFNYQVFDIRYEQERGDARFPYLFQADIQFSQEFGKISLSRQQRVRINYFHYLRYRLFAGTMLYRNGLEDNYFNFATQRPTDYLFDLYYIGRSDLSGIWSQQVFAVDGGMRGYTNEFALNYMVSMNLDFVIFRHLGVYGDISFYDDGGTRGNIATGFSLIAIPEFFEVYFPMFDNNSKGGLEVFSVDQIRFVLNINLDDALQRIRRGYF
ncbi:MAG: hypothetical protein LPK47_00625 [Bacteroidota bacterium]|nr:hypothetical protein [Bacteroidota bacterium]